MSELHLTPARRELLQAVADGKVRRHYPLLPDPEYDLLDHGPAHFQGPRYRRVTARMYELNRAGWAFCGERDDPYHHKSPRQWHISHAGERALAGQVPS